MVLTFGKNPRKPRSGHTKEFDLSTWFPKSTPMKLSRPHKPLGRPPGSGNFEVVLDDRGCSPAFGWPMLQKTADRMRKAYSIKVAALAAQKAARAQPVPVVLAPAKVLIMLAQKSKTRATRAETCLYPCNHPRCLCRMKMTKQGQAHHYAHRELHPRKHCPQAAGDRFRQPTGFLFLSCQY